MKINLSKDDLREIFSLFSSPTNYEKDQVYDEKSDHYYKKINLKEEYNLNEAIEDFSLDAFRAVVSFLYSKGFSISKADQTIDLSFIEEYFLD